MRNETNNPQPQTHCNVVEQRHLVSEMSRCDAATSGPDERYECYLNASRDTRESSACMYS